MLQVLIAGGGFAGLYAARRLARLAEESAEVEVALLNDKSYTAMLPALPDVAGGRIDEDYLAAEISSLLPSSISFRQEKITAFDLYNKQVLTDKKVHQYDYLLIATGSATNFYGFNQHLDELQKLTTLEDAVRINKDFTRYLNNAPSPHAVIVGGGYTGLELACNLKCRAAKEGKDCTVSVVEVKNTILPMIPESIRAYISKQAERYGINIATGESLKEFDGQNVVLSDDTAYSDVFLCWTAGTRFSVPQIKGDIQTLPDGRIKVDEKLRIPGHPDVFAAGDAAAIEDEGEYLRKAVNFAVYSGKHAAGNVLKAIKGHDQSAFSPTDLGWVIPFCDTGAGKVFGRFVIRGKPALRLHYFMCGLRNYDWQKRCRFWKYALKRF